MMKNKKSASALISDLKRKTRKAYNSEDKQILVQSTLVCFGIALGAVLIP